jgi:uncharacterized membrane protein YgdD (TMEM256/DUF423 family)
MDKQALLSGSVLMTLGVLTGAFGAHVVQDLLSPERYEVYQTAVEYHFYHALGLLLIGVMGVHSDRVATNRWYARSVWLLQAGVLIFSGSLYLLTLTDTGWLGAITPFGGAAFVAGWLCFTMAILSAKRRS